MMGRPWLNYVFENYPSIFAAQKLNFQPDKYQKDFLDSKATDIMLNWTRQSGKTTVAAIKAVHKARYRPNTLVLIVSATQRQAGILQGRAKRYIYQATGQAKERLIRTLMLPVDPLDEDSKLVRCSVLSFELANGSEVVSVPASEETIRGYSPNMIILDEASRIPDNIWNAITPMRATSSAENPIPLIVLSTPAGRRGVFFREWTSDDPIWWKSAMPADECPRISKEFLAREQMKNPMYRQEYFLEFVELTGGVFDSQHVRAIFESDEEGDMAREEVASESVRKWQIDFTEETGDAYR